MTTHYGVRLNGYKVRINRESLILFGTATACGAGPEGYESMTDEKALVSCEVCTAKLGVTNGS